MPPDDAVIDRLRDDVLALAGAADGGGPRPVGSAGHRAARAYLRTALAATGARPAFGERYEHEYGVPFANLVGRIVAARPPRGRRGVLVGAHYDTVSTTPGADDNAAAVAIALEVARAVHAAPLPDADVLVALFDAEEPPHFLGPSMGSVRLFEDVLRTAGEIPVPIVLDLCGHALQGPLVERLDLANALAVVGLETDAALCAAFDRAAATVGPQLTLLPLPHAAIGGDVSDYHVFRVNALPYVFLSCGEGPHYHRPSDTVEHLDFTKMAAVARFVECLARAIADVGPSQAAVEEAEAAHIDRTAAAASEAEVPAWHWFATRLIPRLGAEWASSDAMLADLQQLVRAVRSGGL